MWDFKPQFKSYICLETFITEKNSNRTMYIISLDSKQNIRIGRGHDSDVRVTDISVSRFHAIIRKDRNGSFYLEDNNSKFGSLVLVQVPRLRVLRRNSLSLQIGRTMLTFDIKKPFSIFSCFYSKSSNKDKPTDYQVMNSKNVSFENCNFIKIQNENLNEEDDLDVLSSLKASIKLTNQENLDEDNQEIPIQSQEMKECIISNKNTFSFKVIEAQEEKNNQLEVEEIINQDNEDSQNEIEIKKASDYRVNRNRVYLERANTNIEFARLDIQSLKEKFKKDLESLRNFEAEQSPLFTDKEPISLDEENHQEEIIIPQDEVHPDENINYKVKNEVLKEIEIKKTIKLEENPINPEEEQKFEDIPENKILEKENIEMIENSQIHSSEEKVDLNKKIDEEIPVDQLLLTDFNQPIESSPRPQENMKFEVHIKENLHTSEVPVNNLNFVKDDLEEKLKDNNPIKDI